MLEILIDSNQSLFRQVSVLSGIPYVFDFSWSERSESWYLDFYLQTDTDPEPIRTGIRITNNWPLLLGCVHDSRPPGELFPADLGNGPDAGRYDLGKRVKLYYRLPT
jgi:hypothetical protein